MLVSLHNEPGGVHITPLLAAGEHHEICRSAPTSTVLPIEKPPADPPQSGYQTHPTTADSSQAFHQRLQRSHPSEINRDSSGEVGVEREIN
jgi:hypothetical protein